MEPRDLIVLTPPGVADPSLAIAACRAGAAVVLDREFAGAGGAALAKLARFAGTGFGVQLRADASDELFALITGRTGPDAVKARIREGEAPAEPEPHGSAGA